MKTLHPSLDAGSQGKISEAAKASQRLSFSEQERICEHLFSLNGPFWHVLTPGNKTQLLFITDDDYKFCINSIAVCSTMFRIRILVDAIMDNHVHLIVGGELVEVKAFFDRFRKKLERYFRTIGRPVDLSDFRCDEPIPITDLGMLRNEIVYVIRNPFVAILQALPFNYRWGGLQTGSR